MACLIGLCAAVAPMVFTACTVAEISVEEIGGQLQQGLQGRGKIVPYDPTRDGFGSEFN